MRLIPTVVAAVVLVGLTVVGAATTTTLSIAGQTPRPAFRPASVATLVPPSALVAHPNPALGYSISLPPNYRRAVSAVDAERVGRDVFTPRTDAEDRELCMTEQRGGQSPERVADLKVDAYANPDGLSAVDFASQPTRRVPLTTIESTKIDGRDAARIVHQPSGDTAYYVVSANGRLYEIAPLIFEQPTTQPRGWLDQIAATFRVIPANAAPASPSRRTLCGA